MLLHTPWVVVVIAPPDVFTTSSTKAESSRAADAAAMYLQRKPSASANELSEATLQNVPRDRIAPGGLNGSYNRIGFATDGSDASSAHRSLRNDAWGRRATAGRAGALVQP